MLIFCKPWMNESLKETNTPFSKEGGMGVWRGRVDLRIFSELKPSLAVGGWVSLSQPFFISILGTSFLTLETFFLFSNYIHRTNNKPWASLWQWLWTKCVLNDVQYSKNFLRRISVGTKHCGFKMKFIS